MENEKRKTVDLVEQARQLRQQAEALEKMVKKARGTRRNTKVPWFGEPKGDKLMRPTRSPYFVGDEGSTEQLMDAVQRMLAERPWNFHDMLEALGARDNRIKGVIMRLQREGVRVVDVAPSGTGKALWFIPSDAAVRVIARARRQTVRR